MLIWRLHLCFIVSELTLVTGQQRKDDSKHWVISVTIILFENPSAKLHIPLKISFFRGAKKDRYKVNSQQNTQLITRHVHVVTLKHFAVLLFLPPFCVNSLLTKCYKILYMLMIIISEYRSSLDLLCVWCKFNVALLFKLLETQKTF